MRFDAEGHACIAPPEAYDLIKSSPRKFVNRLLLAGTPLVFSEYLGFCAFREELASRLHVHPCSVIVRGSAKLGFSMSPERGKAWKPFKKSRNSDIDVAIVDQEYFSRLDQEIRQWEGRQNLPGLQSQALEREINKHADRQHYRSYNCIADRLFPHNTCVAHKDIIEAFDTQAFCDMQYRISAFVFRDWWSIRNRWEDDLRKLIAAVESDQIPHAEGS